MGVRHKEIDVSESESYRLSDLGWTVVITADWQRYSVWLTRSTAESANVGLKPSFKGVGT